MLAAIGLPVRGVNAQRSELRAWRGSTLCDLHSSRGGSEKYDSSGVHHVGRRSRRVSIVIQSIYMSRVFFIPFAVSLFSESNAGVCQCGNEAALWHTPGLWNPTPDGGSIFSSPPAVIRRRWHPRSPGARRADMDMAISAPPLAPLGARPRFSLPSVLTPAPPFAHGRHMGAWASGVPVTVPDATLRNMEPQHGSNPWTLSCCSLSCFRPMHVQRWLTPNRSSQAHSAACRRGCGCHFLLGLACLTVEARQGLARGHQCPPSFLLSAEQALIAPLPCNEAHHLILQLRDAVRHRLVSGWWWHFACGWRSSIGIGIGTGTGDGVSNRIGTSNCTDSGGSSRALPLDVCSRLALGRRGEGILPRRGRHERAAWHRRHHRPRVQAHAKEDEEARKEGGVVDKLDEELTVAHAAGGQSGWGRQRRRQCGRRWWRWRRCWWPWRR